MDCCNSKTYLSKEVVKGLKIVLYIAFFINAGMFLVELVSGVITHSNALSADSLDMFGDAFVYGLSLFVLTKHHKVQARASMVKGAVMLLIGLYVFAEAFYKMVHPIVPPAQAITLIGILALVANGVCLFLLTRHKDKNINMKSSWICSRNDMFGNVGVIIAGISVAYFNSMWPDIIVGMGIAGLAVYFSAGIIKDVHMHNVKYQTLQNNFMVKEIEIKNKKYYKCEECGLVYLYKEIAEKCQNWCKKYHTCNLEIIKYAQRLT